MIKVDDLSRSYGDFLAVDSVSFQIEPGEIVGLLGHNGAGKTTIMKMLTGFLEPSAGRVEVGGVEVQSYPLAVQARLGYLPENLPLYPEMSVIAYLDFTARLRGVEGGAPVAEAIAATELEDKAFEPIANLSRGYKQRLGVAQAILHKPEFLILDEPTNGLDPKQTQHMRTLIKQLAEKATIILSTHIMQEVSAICDRALILKSGRLGLDAKLSDLRYGQAISLVSDAGAAVAETLKTISRVKGLATQDYSNKWQIEVDGDPETAVEEITRTLVAASIPVRGITPVNRDLETVFREVNEEA